MVNGDLDNRVNRTTPTVRPSAVKVQRIGMAERPDNADDGVEKRWLLPQMIVVICDALYMAGEDTPQLRGM